MTDTNILLYQTTTGDIKLDVRIEDETVWLTIDHMATLFQKSRATINEHILNIFSEAELEKEACMRKIGNSDFTTKPTHFYNLDVIISVGYRVKSKQGTQFRIWATQRLRDYIIKGFVLNDDRFKTGQSMTYFDELHPPRGVRGRSPRKKRLFSASPRKERGFQGDFVPLNPYRARHLVHQRVDATLPLMGMHSLDKKDQKSIQKKDTAIAKNYLTESEMKLLGLLVEQYLAFAETMAQQQTPMTMQDWASRLDAIIQLNGKELLTHAGKISHQLAEEKAALEYKRFKEFAQKQDHDNNLAELARDIKRLSKNT